MLLYFPENMDTKVLKNELAMLIDTNGLIKGYFEKDDVILQNYTRISRCLHIYEEKN